MDIISKKTQKRHVKVLLQYIFQFTRKQQSEALDVLSQLKDIPEISKFLISSYSKFEDSLKAEVLITLVKLGQPEGLIFALNTVVQLTPTDQPQVLQSMFENELLFDKPRTEILLERFKSTEALDLKAEYLKLLCKGDVELVLPVITSCLIKQPDLIVCSAMECLIVLDRLEDIPLDVLDAHSSTTFFRLAIIVATVYGLRYQREQDKKFLQKGLNILSFLLNESDRDSKLAAMEGAVFFKDDGRILDWIGSLLLSESDEEVLQKVCMVLEGIYTEPVKNLLLKACERRISSLQESAIRMLIQFKDADLFDYLVEYALKEKANTPLTVLAVEALSHIVPDEKESDYIQFLDDDNLEIQRAAILGCANWDSQESYKALELRYQEFSGMNKSVAGYVLFLKGAPYVLDDMLEWLATEKANEQRTAMVGLNEIYSYIKYSEAEDIHPDVINNLQVWYQDAETKWRDSGNVLLDFKLKLLMPLRELILERKYETALDYIDAQSAEDKGNFYVMLANLIATQQLKRDMEPEQCLNLIARASDCLVTYGILSDFFETNKRKAEYLLNQLQLLEARHEYFARLMQIMNEISKSELESPLFMNLLKIVDKAALPKDGSIHQIFTQILVKVKKYDQAFRHYTFGFYSMEHENYYPELAAAALKCGYFDLTDEICRTVSKRCKPAQADRLRKLNQKLVEVKEGRSL
jgi:HEAT repeat protein